MTKRKRKAAGRTQPHHALSDAGPVPRSSLSPVHSSRAWLLAGLVALFVARPLFPTEAANYGDGLPVVMLWIALAVLWLLAAVGQPQWKVRFGWTDTAVCVLVGWHTVAGVAAAFSGSPRPAVNMTWEWIGMGLSFLLARQLIVTRREARAVMAVMASLAVALAGYGLYQYAVELPAMRAAYEADPAAALRNADLWVEPGSPQAKLFEDRLQGTEPIAAFALTNSLAGYLAPWLIVLLGIAFVGGPTARRMVLAFLCAAPVAACLVLTKGRSAYAASAFGLLLLWWTARQGRTKRLGWRLPLLAGVLLAVALGGAILTGGLDRKVATEAGKSLGYRVQYWQSTLRMIADRPLLGCGPGNYQFEYTRYKLPEASEEVADPHNFPLEIWSTAGTPALLALVFALGAFFRRTPLRRADNELAHSVKSSSADAAPDDAAWFALAGGAAGFLLAIPLGLMSWAPPGLMATAIGLPLAAVAMGLLSGWVRHGRLPPALPAVGAVVLLVHLLAAGALGFPGVAGTLWLLLAVGLQGDEPKAAPRTAAFGTLALALSLAVACHQTAYAPVLQSRHALQAARDAVSAGRIEEAERWLQAAAEADPLAAEPWRDLAALAMQIWEQTGNPQSIELFRHADAATTQREPNSAAAWFTSGQWQLRAYRVGGAAGDAEGAVASYRRSVDLYPNSSLYRAELAQAYDAVGDAKGFEREAAESLRLDQLTPHADKKLPGEMREGFQRRLESLRHNF
ncbi:MAG: O-antigen ligase family protein [Thermoguttaceae bacterium]|jgi:tetratricopeptide (TPR) repeat protein|nr:O-antigen ligase family protein [Thermoguttaceae bacterium]